MIALADAVPGQVRGKAPRSCMDLGIAVLVFERDDEGCLRPQCGLTGQQVCDHGVTAALAPRMRYFPIVFLRISLEPPAIS